MQMSELKIKQVKEQSLLQVITNLKETVTCSYTDLWTIMGLTSIDPLLAAWICCTSISLYFMKKVRTVEATIDIFIKLANFQKPRSCKTDGTYLSSSKLYFFMKENIEIKTYHAGAHFRSWFLEKWVLQKTNVMMICFISAAQLYKYQFQVVRWLHRYEYTNRITDSYIKQSIATMYR